MVQTSNRCQCSADLGVSETPDFENSLAGVRELERMLMLIRITAKPELVTVASFFDFFTPPATPAGGTIITTEDWLRLIDFKIGEKIKQDIIPHAVDYYTGVAGEDYDKYSPHEGEVEYVNYGDIDDEQ